MISKWITFPSYQRISKWSWKVNNIIYAISSFIWKGYLLWQRIFRSKLCYKYLFRNLLSEESFHQIWRHIICFSSYFVHYFDSNNHYLSSFQHIFFKMTNSTTLLILTSIQYAFNASLFPPKWKKVYQKLLLFCEPIDAFLCKMNLAWWIRVIRRVKSGLSTPWWLFSPAF